MPLAEVKIVDKTSKPNLCLEKINTLYKKKFYINTQKHPVAHKRFFLHHLKNGGMLLYILHIQSFRRGHTAHQITFEDVILSGV